MTCDTARSVIHAYVDDELDASEKLNMDEHLRTCQSCSQLHSHLETLRNVIHTQANRYSAPDALRRRIQTELRKSARPVSTPVLERPVLERPVLERPVFKRPVFDWPVVAGAFFNWRWAAIAATIVVAAIAGWLGLRFVSPAGERNLIAQEIVSSHVRSLMANHLVDEPSSDQHTVKPWFAGKLDFSPVVKNLDAQGFPLAGGRLDYIDNRSVAALVYRRRQHVINLFVWPVAKDTSDGEHKFTINGFNAIRWTGDGMTYWAISDLNKQELQLFSRLIAENGR